MKEVGRYARKVGENCAFRVVFLVAVFVLTVPLICGALDKKSEIRIGASTCLSGPFGGLGQEEKAGLEYAVKDINDAGGITVAEGANLPMRLIVYDDRSDQTVGVGNFERLITFDKVDFVFGSMSTPIIMAAAGVAEKYGVPHLTAGTNVVAAHKGELYKWTWIIFHRADRQMAVVHEMLNTIGAGISKKVALWRENTVLGEELEKNGVPSFKAAGWDVVVIPYSVGSKDFSDVVFKTKQAGVSCVVGIPTPVDAIGMIRQMKELGYTPGMVVWPRGASVMQFRDALGPDAEYVADSVGWSPAVKYPGNLELCARYSKETGRIAAAVLGPSYACVQVLADAIKRAGSLDKTKVRDAIQKTDLMTVNGRLTFPSQGSPVVKAIINQWQKGRYVTVWPPDMADEKPVFPMPPWDKR